MLNLRTALYAIDARPHPDPAVRPLRAPVTQAADATPVSDLERDRVRLRHDAPVLIPASRGRTSEALLELLDSDPDRPAVTGDLIWSGSPDEVLLDEDLQLALWLGYELHYRGLAGVDDRWEWHPALLTARRQWEGSLTAGFRAEVERRHGPSRPLAPAEVVAALEALVSGDDGPSLAGWLMREATAAQFTEFLTHRSLYHLKEADPHTWMIPRLSGAVKAAMVTIQLDEYGLGRLVGMHAQLFRALLEDWGVDATYGAHLERVPAVTLLASNLIAMFGLHRRWRGALVGHLAAFEMSSTVPNGRYARAHRRLGGGEAAAAFFDEHVVADAVHEQLAAHQLAAGLARTEPDEAAAVVFGARCGAVADDLFTQHLLAAWSAHRSSLRDGWTGAGR